MVHPLLVEEGIDMNAPLVCFEAGRVNNSNSRSFGCMRTGSQELVLLGKKTSI